MKQITLVISVSLLAACHRPSPQVSSPVPAELSEHGKIFSKRIEKVGDNIYVAIGYGLANSILIEGKDSCIIIDCLESQHAGAEVKRAFDSVCSKPLKAIIYTHFHTDHTSGAAALAGNSRPDVYAHELLPVYLDQTNTVVHPITEKRSYRMFGVYLHDEALVHCGIGPRLQMRQNTTLGILRPTVTFRDSLDVTIAGMHLRLIHAPGETPDQIIIWLPDSRILFCGDNVYKAFPNLYTIRGTPYRDVNLWRQSVDKMRALRPEVLIPSHTEVLHGEKNIYDVLTAYRDAIQYVHDQTVRGINQGLTPDQLAEQIQLPPHLKNHPWLQEYYGKVSWCVRAIFNGYLGFFDGNPATLLPLSPATRALRMEELAGGRQNMLQQIETSYKREDYQWALELTDYYLTLYPNDPAALRYRIACLKALGNAQTNPNARHYYLTCAMELEGLKNEGLVKPTPELVSHIPLSVIFHAMATRLDASKSAAVNKRVLFEFTDTKQQWTVEVRNGVAEVQPYKIAEPHITVRVKETVWKELAAKIRQPLPTFLKGEIEIEGGQAAFVQFMQLFDTD
ncbi:MAG: MBL fold metallo-hydrolase [Chitinophagales bacterium]|nr:MBL fold metallo-hydrolase [Chitinophagales bacterium]MDW8418855.1 alkyl sulfatase dimerization domain-containing protein [Chitinophagales bacterium]